MKRRYVRRSGAAVIRIIARIRGRNIRLWMKLLEMAVTARPEEAKQVLSQIAENDNEIGKWTRRI